MGVGTAFTSFCIAQRELVVPLYDKGVAQGPLSFVNALGSLLMVPGRTLSFVLISPNNHHDTQASLILAYIITFVLFTILGALLMRVRRPLRQPAEEAVSEPASSPLDRTEATATEQAEPAAAPALQINRRQFLQSSIARTATLAATTAGAGAIGYSFLLEPRLLPVTTTVHHFPGLPRELDSLRIVQLSDVHHGHWIPLSFIERMVRQVNALDADIIVINGDNVSGHPRYIRPVVKAFAKLRAKIRVVGVLGNHDWWEGAGITRERFAAANIPLLDNSRTFLTPERRIANESRTGLCIAGVGDYWEDEVNVAAALHYVPEDMPRILLSHNPDVAETPEVARRVHRIDLMLSGHTHGGQVRLPILGTPIVPSNYGSKYAAGLVQGPGCPVYITRGIGMTVLPIRFCMPPEISLHLIRAS